MRKTQGIVTAAALAFGMVCVGMAQADGRPGKDRGAEALSFRAASGASHAGFEKTTMGDGSVLYVAQRPAFDGSGIVASAAAGRDAVDLTLSTEATQALVKAAAEKLAVYQDGRLVSVAAIHSLDNAGNLRLSGLSQADVSRLTSFQAVAKGPQMKVVARQTSGRAGDLFTFDVYASGVSDLKTFQATLDASGGTAGSLTREEARMEKTRGDYAFGTLAAIDAVDDIGGRMGATLINGSVNATAPMYLGTVSYRASQDAAGPFNVKVRMDDDSLLQNSNHEVLQFTPVNATITVGARGSN